MDREPGSCGTFQISEGVYISAIYILLVHFGQDLHNCPPTPEYPPESVLPPDLLQ